MTPWHQVNEKKRGEAIYLSHWGTASIIPLIGTGLVRSEEELVLFCRSCAHEVDSKLWEAALRPALAERLQKLGKGLGLRVVS